MGTLAIIVGIVALVGGYVAIDSRVWASLDKRDAKDVPFLLDAYHEIDEMGLNGPRMAPPLTKIQQVRKELGVPLGGFKAPFFSNAAEEDRLKRRLEIRPAPTPEQRLIAAGQHPVLPAPAPARSDGMKDVEFRYRDGLCVKLRVPEEVMHDAVAVGRLYEETRTRARQHEAIAAYLRAQTDAAPPDEQARLMANVRASAVDDLPADPWLRDLTIKRERGWS